MLLDVNKWDKWVATRSEVVQDLCHRFPPYSLYQLTFSSFEISGIVVELMGYSGDGSMEGKVVDRDEEFPHGCTISGIHPEHLLPYERPSVRGSY